jgi:hypothetical protein
MLFVIALFHQCNSRLTVGVNTAASLQASFPPKLIFPAVSIDERTIFTKMTRHLGLLQQ